jgi:hypothetical protein
MKEEDIKREKERRVEEERLKLKMNTNKAKTKKKNWFMESYHSLKRKLI